MQRLEPTIRRLTATDTELWRTIRLAMRRDNPGWFDLPYEQIAAWPLEKFTEELLRGGDPVYAAIAGEDIQASASLDYGKGARLAHTGYMWGVYVLPEHRRKGLARRLVQALIANARDAKIEYIHLDVATKSQDAYALYRSLGFQAYGIIPASYRSNGQDHDETKMVLRLTPV